MTLTAATSGGWGVVGFGQGPARLPATDVTHSRGEPRRQLHTARWVASHGAYTLAPVLLLTIAADALRMRAPPPPTSVARIGCSLHPPQLSRLGMSRPARGFLHRNLLRDTVRGCYGSRFREGMLNA
jgi:hypothetical protein